MHACVCVCLQVALRSQLIVGPSTYSIATNPAYAHAFVAMDDLDIGGPHLSDSGASGQGDLVMDFGTKGGGGGGGGVKAEGGVSGRMEAAGGGLESLEEKVRMPSHPLLSLPNLTWKRVVVCTDTAG